MVGLMIECCMLAACRFVPRRREKRMIVISRQRDEALVINNDIIITVIDIRDDKVRLGIEVPSGVSVHRKEVFDAIARHNASLRVPSAPEQAPPEPHFGPRSKDRLDRFAAVLEVKVGVPITRQIVIEALREAGIEESQLQALSK